MFKIYLLFGILVVGASGYAYHQVTVANLEKDVMRLETDNRTLKENQVQLKSAVSTAQASLEAEKKNAAKTPARTHPITTGVSIVAHTNPTTAENDQINFKVSIV